MRRRPLASLVVALALVAGGLAGCGPAGPDPLATFNGASLTIDARDLTFDPDIVTMPAGQPLRLVLNNHDEGVEHNLHVFRGDTDFGKSPSVIGPGLAAVELPAMASGSYQFECTIHPDMIGTLIVAAGATPGPTPGDDGVPSDDIPPPDDTTAPDSSRTPGSTKTTRPTETSGPTKTPRSGAATPRPSAAPSATPNSGG